MMKTYLSIGTTLVICVIACLGARPTNMTSNYDNSTKTLQLYCQFAMEDYGMFFWVKWRKDDHLFLNYNPMTTIDDYTWQGVHVNRNMTQCSQTSCTVFLNNVSHLSSGEYSCEMTSDSSLTSDSSPYSISSLSLALNVTIDEPTPILPKPTTPYISNLTALNVQNSSENIQLYCEYNMAGQDILAVKWYKDKDEFLRYVPSEFPILREFSVKGVHVDLTKTHCSNRSCIIFMQRQPMNMSAGKYICEVNSDAPSFTTVSQTYNITIDEPTLHHSLILPEPTTGLYISNLTALTVQNSSENILLYCEYNMTGQDIYAVKWYKGRNEFLRYTPHESPILREYPVIGVHVDTPKTHCSNSSCMLILKQWSLNSTAGEYVCEVISEAPFFTAVSKRLNITITEPKPDSRQLLLEPQRTYISNRAALDLHGFNEEIRLYCEYDTAGQDIYSVKWYKDKKEFLRYVPSEIPILHVKSVMGVDVDRTKIHCSNRSCELFLKQRWRPMTLSAGEYVCEVTSDAPFSTTYHKKHTITLTKSSDPHISKMLVPHCQDPEQDMLLYCEYDMAGQELYVVKWYKGHNEFFRYMPHLHPNVHVFPVKGVHVDLTRTSCSKRSCMLFTNTLTKIFSSDTYVCEITSAAPNFFTTKKTRNVTMVDPNILP